jgi:hypothetical protein
MKISAAVVALPKIAPSLRQSSQAFGDAGATQDASAAEVVDKLPPQPSIAGPSRRHTKPRETIFSRDHGTILKRIASINAA